MEDQKKDTTLNKKDMSHCGRGFAAARPSLRGNAGPLGAGRDVPGGSAFRARRFDDVDQPDAGGLPSGERSERLEIVGKRVAGPKKTFPAALIAAKRAALGQAAAGVAGVGSEIPVAGEFDEHGRLFPWRPTGGQMGDDRRRACEKLKPHAFAGGWRAIDRFGHAEIGRNGGDVGPGGCMQRGAPAREEGGNPAAGADFLKGAESSWQLDCRV